MSDQGAYPPELFVAAWESAYGPFQKGPFDTENGLIAAITEQEKALLAFAATFPFSAGEVAELRKHPSVGGAEHEVFVPENIGHPAFVWKFTRPGRWGLLRATPVEYLDRLDKLDKISNTHVLIRGIAIASTGLPFLVSSMDYVHGKHPGGKMLHKRLCDEGWEQIADPDNMLSYRHKIDGTTMRDAHAKNFIWTPTGKLVPIDVIFME